MDQTTDFDFDSIEDMPTGTVRIKDADGAPTSMVITLAGPENPDRKRRDMTKARRFRSEFAKSGKMPVSDPQDEYDDTTDEMVACTLDWTGARTPFSAAAARALYTDPKRQWLRVQVVTALGERSRFLASAATS